MTNIRPVNHSLILLICLIATSVWGEEVVFDAQSYSVISGSGVTASGAVAWNALNSDPGGFNIFTPVSSASVTSGGISVSIIGILGSWAGNSAYITSLRPLENDYFVVGSGSTATMTISGLVPGGEYYLLFWHGRLEPAQLRQLTVVVNGQQIGTMDNQSAGGSGNVEGTNAVADGSGEIIIGLTGGGAEGDIAGFSIESLTPTWAGYPVMEGGLVDTGTAVGTLYVETAPWLYSFALEAWVYAEEANIGTEGAWLFVAN